MRIFLGTLVFLFFGTAALANPETSLQVKVSCTEITAYQDESPAVAQLMPVTLQPGQVTSLDQFFNNADRQLVVSMIDEGYLHDQDGHVHHMADTGYYVVAINRLALDGSGEDADEKGCDYHVSGRFSNATAVVLNRMNGTLNHMPAELKINYERKAEQASCKDEFVNVTCSLDLKVIR
jgi:hypothetical protein